MVRNVLRHIAILYISMNELMLLAKDFVPQINDINRIDNLRKL